MAWHLSGGYRPLVKGVKLALLASSKMIIGGVDWNHDWKNYCAISSLRLSYKRINKMPRGMETWFRKRASYPLRINSQKRRRRIESRACSYTDPRGSYAKPLTGPAPILTLPPAGLTEPDKCPARLHFFESWGYLPCPIFLVPNFD